MAILQLESWRRIRVRYHLLAWLVAADLYFYMCTGLHALEKAYTFSIAASFPVAQVTICLGLTCTFKGILKTSSQQVCLGCRQDSIYHP